MIECLGCKGNNTKVFLNIVVAKNVKSSFGVAPKSRVIYVCDDCELKFIDISNVNVQEEMEMYDQTYHEEMAGENKEEEIRSGIHEQFIERLELIEQYKASGELLDIGASTGVFLEEAAKKGFKISGVEPSDFACKGAEERLKDHGAKIECGIIDSSKFLKENQYDVLTLWDVIEHCYDINADIKTLGGGLKEDGILVIRTPDSDSIFFKIANWAYTFSFKLISFPVSAIYHADHQVFFNRKSITSFLKRHNFEVLCERNESLQWRRFKSCEFSRGFLVNFALGTFYWVGRFFNRGHGLLIIAKKSH